MVNIADISKPSVTAQSVAATKPRGDSPLEATSAIDALRPAKTPTRKKRKEQNSLQRKNVKREKSRVTADESDDESLIYDEQGKQHALGRIDIEV